MILFAVAVGILLYIPCISRSTEFSTEIPESLCSEHKQAFYLCERQREQCDRESIRTDECGLMQAECIKKIPVSTRDCRSVAEHKEKQAKLEHPNGILTHEMINEQVEMEVMMSLDWAYRSIKEHCFRGENWG